MKGTIKVFYAKIDEAAESNRNSSDTARNNARIIQNLHDINDYVNQHKSVLENDEALTNIFNKQDKVSGLGSFYEYMAKSQSDCLIRDRDLFVQDENPNQINELISCLNTQSEYEKANPSENSLLNPQT